MESEQAEERACDRCGAPATPDAGFCGQCGAQIGLPASRSCQACGASLGPAARYCAVCGARAGLGPPGRASRPGVSWIEGLRTDWGRLRTRAEAIDWVRTGWVAVPIAALFLVGLLGYALGRRGEGAAPAGGSAVTAARGWRGDEETERVGGGAASPRLEVGRPIRFRDFRISASSWEQAHPPALATDGDPYTFWHAWKTEKFPEGEWLILTFPAARRIARLGLLPGRAGPGARAEGRIKSLLVKSPNTPPRKLFFDDRPEMQYRDLQPPIETRQLILRIGTVLPGRETRHIVIPELQVWGYPAPERVTLRQKVERENPTPGG